MKPFTKGVVFFMIITSCLFSDFIYAQSVMLPNDPTPIFNNKTAPLDIKPFVPWDNDIHKWYRGNIRDFNPNNPNLWNSWGSTKLDSYKPYIKNKQTFRLKFPKSYVAGSNKRYPMVIFMHGNGEWAVLNGDPAPPKDYEDFENNYHLLWGGQEYRDWVDNGSYDGFILFLQVQNYGWGDPHYITIKEICDYMVINNQLDPFAITVNGLSGGAKACWALMITQPTLIAGALPMSGAAPSNVDGLPVYKYTPIWIFQGGDDIQQDENIAWGVINTINANGGRIQWTYYPHQQHNTWQNAMGDPRFLPFIKSSYAANPWPLFYQSGQTPPPNWKPIDGDKPVNSLPVNDPISFYFTSGSPINITMGVAPGFSSYEWSVNGVPITGANSNTFTANKPGTYQARISKNGVVSEWSRIPIKIFLNGSLPVNWISFTGDLVSEGIELKWQVENNEQAQYYQIEHSTDGINFTKVDELPNVKDVKSYKYTYKTKEAGTHYFRILQADFDRKFIFSKVIAVKIKGDANYTVRLISNPARTNFADLEIGATKPGKAQVEIWSTSGAKISSKQQQIVVGTNRFQVPLNNAAPGMYLLKIQVGNAVITEKLIKL